MICHLIYHRVHDLSCITCFVAFDLLAEAYKQDPVAGLYADQAHAVQAKSFNGSGASIDSIQIPVGPRLGNDVVEVAGLSKGYGDRLLLDNVSFSIPAGAIVGVQQTCM